MRHALYNKVGFFITCPYGKVNLTQFPPKMAENKKGFFMNKAFKLFGIIALAAIMFSATSCATSSSTASGVNPHGLISGNASAAIAIEGKTAIAEYTTWVHLIDVGYAEFNAAVRAAKAQGRDVTTVTRWFYIFTRTTAYAN